MLLFYFSLLQKIFLFFPYSLKPQDESLMTAPFYSILNVHMWILCIVLSHAQNQIITISSLTDDLTYAGHLTPERM